MYERRNATIYHMRTAPHMITVLAENTAQGGQGLGLLGEHGLSLWIETVETCVLFDTGQGLVLGRNAEHLRVDLDCADSIVLSHGHYDHTGGLSHALNQAPCARLFLHPAALATRFACREGKSREIGMCPDVREVVNARRPPVIWTNGPTEIAAGMFVTGPIPRRTVYEDTGGAFFLDADGKDPDPIMDDQAMWIETSSGLIVLLGCAHSGVINTLEYICKLAGRKPIRAILGGMHLGSATDERLTRTIESLSQLDVQEMWPCHCTGATATARLMTVFGGRSHPCGVGTRVEF
jgi:7,8-dihydropterin-6-yl-methyl-4-(beta-D-ribofuranosyl)aminobenzene 5'-phosphate synthase